MSGGKLLIIGSGGHGRSVLGTALASGVYDEIEFATNADNPDPVEGFRILDERKLGFDEMRYGYSAVFVAIGDNAARLWKVRRLIEMGIEVPILVHPTASVSAFTEMGAGTLIGPNAVVNSFAKLGIGCIVNTGAVVEHDCVVADGVHLSPNAAIGGGTELGEGSWLCISSCTADHVLLPAWSVLAAGSSLVRSASKSGLYAGSPAVLKRASGLLKGVNR